MNAKMEIIHEFCEKLKKWLGVLIIEVVMHNKSNIHENVFKHFHPFPVREKSDN